MLGTQTIDALADQAPSIVSTPSQPNGRVGNGRKLYTSESIDEIKSHISIRGHAIHREDDHGFVVKGCPCHPEHPTQGNWLITRDSRGFLHGICHQDRCQGKGAADLFAALRILPKPWPSKDAMFDVRLQNIIGQMIKYTEVEVHDWGNDTYCITYSWDEKPSKLVLRPGEPIQSGKFIERFKIKQAAYEDILGRGIRRDDPCRLGKLIARDVHTRRYMSVLYVYDGTGYAAKVGKELIAHFTPLVQSQIDKDSRRFVDEWGYSEMQPKVTLELVKNVVNHLWALSPEEEGFKSGYVNFQNGLRNALNPEECLEHSSEYFVLSALPYDYAEESAPTPVFDKFLAETFDEAQRKRLQEWCGAAMAQDTSFQKFLLMQGVPGSGKRVVCDIIDQVVGDNLSVGMSMTSFGGKHGLQGCLDKRLITVNEVEEKKIDPDAMSRLKQISGSDKVDIPIMYQTAATGRLPLLVQIVSNNLMQFSDPSGSLRRRLLLLRFTNQPEKRDRHLIYKIKTELPQIARWALEGYRRLIKQDEFTPCDEEFTEYMLAEGSPVQTFLSECCKLDSDERTPRSDVYDAYLDWLSCTGIEPTGKRTFESDLVATCPSIQPGKMVRPDRRNAWLGIKLRS